MATANGTVYDCGEFAQVMDKALTLADYAGFDARRRASEAGGRLRGIGFGCYLEASGAGGAPKDVVSVRFRDDGLLHLYGVTGPSGQGHETSFAQIVADGLGVPREGIRYRASDPTEELMGNGTGGSRSLYGAGSAFKVLVGNLTNGQRFETYLIPAERGSREVSPNGGVARLCQPGDLLVVMSFAWVDAGERPLPQVIVMDAENRIVDRPDYSEHLA